MLHLRNPVVENVLALGLISDEQSSRTVGNELLEIGMQGELNGLG